MHAENALPRPLLPLAVGLILLALVATGCGMTSTHIPRASDEWSNGKPVGTAILNNRVGLQVDEAEDGSVSVFMVWVGLEHKLNFARLNEQAEVVVQKSLDLSSDSAQKPQLLVDSTGQLHLVWLARQEQEALQLLYARLTTDGEVIGDRSGEAIALSLPEQEVAHSSMVLDPVGRTVEVFWSDSTPSHPGCYHAALDWSGNVVAPAEMLIPDGILPVAQADHEGFVHLAWRVELEDVPEFHYAVYDPQRRVMGPDTSTGELVTQASVIGGPTSAARFRGLRLGLDEGSVYLAWVVEVRQRADLTSSTFYRAFPQPTLSRGDAADAFHYALPDVTGEAIHVQGADPSLTGQPEFLDGQPPRQVLACYTQVSGPGGAKMLQIAAVDLLDGQVEGQEIVNASHGASLRPTVVMDASGNLHMAWLDTSGFERYQVVYASTSPQAKETLNRVTAYDVVDKALSTVMSILVSFFFTPLILVWMIVPMVWLIAFSWLAENSDTSTLLGRGALGLAMLLQLGTKLSFPDFLSRFPFTFLQSPSLGLLLGRWIVPVFLAALSAGVAWAYLKRRRSRSIFGAYFIYAIVDSFLTLVVYVALPMGW